MTHTADIVVAGAGHNSLITAAYLAKAGHGCLVLDARPIPGGGAATEELLRALIDYVGHERVLLGSDYPFDMGDQRHVETVRALGLDPRVEARILAGNAEELLET